MKPEKHGQNAEHPQQEVCRTNQITQPNRFNCNTLCLENIAASDLDKKYAFKVEVRNDTGKSVTAHFSSLTYCYSVLDYDGYDENLKNLAKEIYLYNLAANDYVDTQSN